MLRVHILDALDECDQTNFAPTSVSKRAFRLPTILDARENRFLLPNRSPVRLLSHA